MVRFEVRGERPPRKSAREISESVGEVEEEEEEKKEKDGTSITAYTRENNLGIIRERAGE